MFSDKYDRDRCGTMLLAVDCRSAGRAIDPAPGTCFIPKFMSLARVVPVSPVQCNCNILKSETPFNSLIDWFICFFIDFPYIYRPVWPAASRRTTLTRRCERTSSGRTARRQAGTRLLLAPHPPCNHPVFSACSPRAQYPGALVDNFITQHPRLIERDPRKRWLEREKKDQGVVLLKINWLLNWYNLYWKKDLLNWYALYWKGAPSLK